VLISVPPEDGNDKRYFVWPVWARYRDAVPANPDPGSDFWNHYGSFGGKDGSYFDTIWEFNGKRFLEERNTVMQVKVNGEITLAKAPSLAFVFNGPAEKYKSSPLDEFGYGQGMTGFWLPGRWNFAAGVVGATDAPIKDPPGDDSPVFNNLVPYFSGYTRYSGTGSGGNLFQYEFTAGQDGFKSGGHMEFFLKIPHNSMNDPKDSKNTDTLFAARLAIDPRTNIPPNWYRLVRPFAFDVHDITLQRSGVTILNNVINPSRGERTYVDYHLTKGGQVTIQVFTMDGTMVDILYRGRRDAGEYRVAWAGTNRGGRAVARGMYFIRVVGPDIDEIRKVMVVR
jgi:hypothetical protein